MSIGAVSVAFCLLLSAASADAQTAPAASAPQLQAKPPLSGTVKDSTGGGVPGAKVTVRDAADHTIVAVATSNGVGNWSVASLDPGIYTISVSLPNFKTVRYASVEVSAERPQQLATILEIDSATQAYEPTQYPPTLDEASIAQTDLIDLLPLFKRNSLYFVALLPGVNSDPRHVTVNSTFFGLPSGGVGLFLDASSLNPAQRSLLAVRPSPDEVDEVRLGRSPASDAEYRAPVSVNLIGRSGSNQPDGSVYEYLRPSTGVVTNNYGVRFGGPIVMPDLYDGHGRAFYSLNYDEVRLSANDGAVDEHAIAGRSDLNLNSRERMSISFNWQGDRLRQSEVESTTSGMTAMVENRSTLTAYLVNEVGVASSAARNGFSIADERTAWDSIFWLAGSHSIAGGADWTTSQSGAGQVKTAGWFEDRWHAKSAITLTAGIRNAQPSASAAWYPSVAHGWGRRLLGDPARAMVFATCGRFKADDVGHSCSIALERAARRTSSIQARLLSTAAGSLTYRLTEITFTQYGSTANLRITYGHQTTSPTASDIPSESLRIVGSWYLPKPSEKAAGASLPRWLLHLASDWSLSTVTRIESQRLVDLSVRKQLPFGRRGSFAIQLDTFNVFNVPITEATPLSAAAALTIDDPTDAFDPLSRSFQLMFRIHW